MTLPLTSALAADLPFGAYERDRGDAELVRAAQKGSRDALEELFRRHWPRLYRTAYLVCHDQAAAEDIAQEAFLSAVRALDRFDRRRPLEPWLARIVTNRAIDWTRARAVRREVLTDADVERSADDVSAAPGDDVVAALRALPPEQRAVIVLRHLLGYTPREAAIALDLPVGTVNSRLRRGLDALGIALEAEQS